MTELITAFHSAVPQAHLDELRERLHMTRWPEAETVEDWSQGIPLSVVQQLCRDWAEDYDWRSAERRLNAVPQFRTEIDGLAIHFLHARSPHENAPVGHDKTVEPGRLSRSGTATASTARGS